MTFNLYDSELTCPACIERIEHPADWPWLDRNGVCMTYGTLESLLAYMVRKIVAK